MARITALASMVSAWSVAACSSHATAPDNCNFVDEGALPAAVVAAGDPLSSTASNKALRDAYANAHGREAGFAYYEPFALGDGWAVHILPLDRPSSKASGFAGDDHVVAFVHVGPDGTHWWALSAPAERDATTTQVSFGRPNVTQLIAGGPHEAVLPLMAYQAVVEGDHTRITSANAHVFVGVVDGRPTVFGSVLESRYRWTKPLQGGRVATPSLSELTMPPSDAEQEGVALSWSNVGVEVGARVEGGRELLATHARGKWVVSKLPTTCTPELLP